MRKPLKKTKARSKTSENRTISFSYRSEYKF